MAAVKRAAAAIDRVYHRSGIAAWQNNGIPAHQSIGHVHFHVAGTLNGGGTNWGEVEKLSVDDTRELASRLAPYLMQEATARPGQVFSALTHTIVTARPGLDLEAEVDRFHPGDTIVQRGLHRDGRIHSADSVRVVSDDNCGLLTWLARGSQVIRRTNLTGQSVRKLPVGEQLRVPKIHVLSSSMDRDVLWLNPQQSPYAIAWGFVDGEFEGWYINLQSPARRWWGGIDIHDQALDVLVAADRTWKWKDEDEFAERTGHPLFWDEADAATIRGEAERLIALAEAGQFPFDGTWCNFRPDPSWGPTELPWWWDQLPPGEPAFLQQANYLD